MFDDHRYVVDTVNNAPCYQRHGRKLTMSDASRLFASGQNLRRVRPKPAVGGDPRSERDIAAQLDTIGTERGATSLAGEIGSGSPGGARSGLPAGCRRAIRDL